jgi:DNA-3-methyladenine glycosylase I
MKRCSWADTDNKIYTDYHDFEWGVPSHDDLYLFEMFVLESFHTGLSWLIILKKREAFRKAFDNFNYNIIKDYDENKIEELLNNKDIVRNKSKIVSTIKNAKSFIKIQEEFGSFDKYIWSFSNNEVVHSDGVNYYTTNYLSDKISKDLKKRGFSYMGSVTCYSYLEAIGILNNHMDYCFRYKK